MCCILLVGLRRRRQLTETQWLLNISYVPTIAHYLSRVLCYIPRLPSLDWAAALNPGPLCKDVTAAMVKSRHGVRQLL
jgi:hypothetical protein